MSFVSAALSQQLADHPFHIVLELLFVVALGYLLLQRSARRAAAAKRVNLPSLEEQERRIAAYQSQPFHTDSVVTSNVPVPEFKGITEVCGRDGCHITILRPGSTNPEECLDLATCDFHSFSTLPEVVDVARAAVNAYGVGSCGPRSFYGTIKPHLLVEQDLAKFLKTEDAVVYSFAYATVATLISCFSSRGDYLVYDDGVSTSVVEGCKLSRSDVRTFKHCDMTDLEKRMKEVVAKDSAPTPHRRFVVTEGVFYETGDICPLPPILALCSKYKFRLLLEDGCGFGVLGKTGRGTPEHFNIATMDVDVYIGSLSTSMGAVGGFCAGASIMVDHQRLSASAYVFSASLPPYVTASVSQCLTVLDRDNSFVEKLHAHTKHMREHLRNAHFNAEKIHLVDCVDDASPVIVLAVPPAYVKAEGLQNVENRLQKVINMLQGRKVAVVRNVFTTEEPVNTVSGLRILVKSQASQAEVDGALKAIEEAVKTEFA
ncbi:serine palmitoyltransferase-like protein [Leptomonas pyrrhocoris]|uniref:serine C-palmitoyltransferase n=1 Tax=Leptomonas pyrrhocoris TaxID=157538 RepID=A0A0N0VG76_LEPPY|nr:serine palmitoyltransferase-like protein [Leptomonas pyrrhocoris]KPA82478.1 serine palmitoyltransferase-like protein [Leptomonas pyrrhocoris]|eukprot:XP_015660917.1 serine palmitoyltransferase-like protein [Leptomonas pyrrhocoris]